MTATGTDLAGSLVSEQKRRDGWSSGDRGGVGLGLGLLFGLVFGSLTDQLMLSLAVGLTLGAGWEMLARSKNNAKDEPRP
ncbi:hypothetical protein QLQ12_27830 [Actinoplanes sp. NEAU-A12]|uniref:Glycine zipper family protein n=1 Tax=Actinoplanes sandaracinus TaxID=3045177 RepID=A0ABT6WRS3_9ACTN|nr:hypothetical protein [Actinoplanes sandaracinus]MDI6102435.1 hypothetical protein [Actinoplanes sandaracinus]